MAEMFKLDKQLQEMSGIDCWNLLHRYAGMRNFSTTVKRSYIDGNYFAEINHYLGGGRMHANLKMGVGPTPMQAALDGYRQAIPLDAEMAAIYLECETWLLTEATRIYGRLEQTIYDLALMLANVNMQLIA